MAKLELTLTSLISLARYLQEISPARFAEEAAHIEKILCQGGNLWLLADCIEQDNNESLPSLPGHRIVHEVFWWLVQEMAEQNEC